MARSVMEGGVSQAVAARLFSTTPKTVAKWVARFRAEGVVGLQHRSLRKGPAAAQNQASAHQPLHAQDQRKGRALRSDRLAGMGLRPAYNTSEQRAAELPLWLDHYNWPRSPAVSGPSHQSAGLASPWTTC
jgi:transposase-like protein